MSLSILHFLHIQVPSFLQNYGQEIGILAASRTFSYFMSLLIDRVMHLSNPQSLQYEMYIRTKNSAGFDIHNFKSFPKLAYCIIWGTSTFHEDGQMDRRT